MPAPTTRPWYLTPQGTIDQPTVSKAYPATSPVVPPPTPGGSIQYSVGGGPMRTYDATQRTREGRLGANPETIGGTGFGRTFTPNSAERLNQNVDISPGGAQLGFVPDTYQEEVDLYANQNDLDPQTKARLMMTPEQQARLKAAEKPNAAQESVNAALMLNQFIEAQINEAKNAANAAGGAFDENAARMRLQAALEGMVRASRGTSANPNLGMNLPTSPVTE